MTAVESRAALRGATVVLGDRAILRDADLDLGPGITVLRGANAAGKTTALRALAGLVPLRRGVREAPGQMLYLGHRPQLLHGLTLRENLGFLASMRDGAARVDAALDRWGLADAAATPVERLSAGQRRRGALARIESEPCDVVLLDEPFAELDERAEELLRSSLDDLRRRGATVLVASHAHGELDDLATIVRRVDGGRIQ